MKSRLLLLLLLSSIITLQSFGQSEITRWRGPSGNGIFPSKQLLKKWPADGPEINWTYGELGIGYSSPVITNQKIFVSGMEGETGYVYALTTEGKLLWKAPYSKEFGTSYPGSRSSPSVAGDLLYILSGQGILVCMRTANGEIVWNKDVFRDFDGNNIQWGITETVVVDQDKVYCTPGGKRNNVIALNRFSGKLIWSSPGRGEKSAHCTPLLIEMANRKLLVTMTASHIIGVDADNGELLWSHPQTNRYSIHANTPIYDQDAVYCFSGYGKGGVKLKLIADGSSITKEWFNPTLNSRTGGAILVDGCLYGSGDTNREWQCIDWQTGEQEYSTREIGNGVIIYADGLQYWYSARGELALVKANPSGFEIISETRVTLGSGQHWAHPVIEGGHLYVRHGNTLIAYKIS
ncbi:MAG: PQQ-like beta-propeller repeat protein [Saprospiraceae bacterium]|nr:PQQ-like beta-propeller repeat protein [Saprospiraceae bacterium]